MDYIELVVNITPEIPGKDILIAQLAEIDFESFVEERNIVKAYIPQSLFNESKLKDVSILNDNEFNTEYTINTIKDENWNAQWESNFNPIVVADFCTVKAPFHTQTFTTPHIITINPQMSFGTGHHATTYMMLEAMKIINFNNHSILDMGCGTGVLAILAKQLGASTVWAIDIDEWAYKNTLENCHLNNVSDIKVLKGNASLIPETPEFNTILANINRNILLNDMATYVAALKPNGQLLLSGFLSDDNKIITQKALSLGLKPKHQYSKAEWSLLVFEK